MSVPSLELGDISTIQIGPFGSLLHKADYIDGGVPVINPMHIAADGIAANSSFSVPRSKAESLVRYRLSAGEIIMGRRGEMGRCAVVQPEHAGMICGTGSMKIIPKINCLNPEYLVHMIRTPKARTELENAASGVTMLNLNAKALAKLKIPLPPLEEQKRIAGILDQADALRRLRARALDKLNTLGQAIFHEMFGVPDTNPMNFRSCKLNEIIKIVGGSQPAKKHFLYEDGPDRVPFIQTRDFRTDSYKTYVPKKLAKRPFEKDDVIIGRYGPPVFQIFRGLSGTYNVALMKADPRGNITKDFIYYLLREPRLHSYVVANSERTGGQSGVNLALLNDYPVFEPPMDKQREFSERLEDVEAMKRAGQISCDAAETLFASLQHRAFRGEL